MMGWRPWDAWWHKHTDYLPHNASKGEPWHVLWSSSSFSALVDFLKVLEDAGREVMFSAWIFSTNGKNRRCFSSMFDHMPCD